MTKWIKSLSSSVFCWMALACSLYLLLLPRFDIGAYNDDAVFVLAAKSILKGQYSFLFMPGQPAADFPFPGVPFVLAPFVHFLGPHWEYLEIISVVMVVLAGFLYWRLLRRWFSLPMSLVALCAFAFNPTVVHISGLVLATPYFLVSVLGSFLLLDHLVQTPSRRIAWALGALLGWASLIRPEGIIVLASMAFTLGLFRRWHDLVRVVCAAVPLWFLFMMRSYAAHGFPNAEYANDLLSLKTFWLAHGPVFLDRIKFVMSGFFSRTLLDIPLSSGGLQIINLLIVAGGLFLCMTGIVDLVKSHRIPRTVLTALLLFSVSYFAIFVLWPAPTSRYLVPLIPITVILLIQGLRFLLRNTPLRRSGVLIAAVTLIVFYGHENCSALYQSLWQRYPDYLAPAASLAWLRTHTLPEDLVLSPMVPSVFLYSHRQGLSFLFAHDEEEFQYLLEKHHIRYIVDRPMHHVALPIHGAFDPNEEWHQIRRWIALYPERYIRAYYEPTEKVSIYRVTPNVGLINAYDLYLSALSDFEMAQWAKGFEKLRDCERLYPWLASAYNAEGATHFIRRDDLQAARQALEKAIAIQPDYVMALLNLSRVYHALGNRDLATKYLQKSVDASVVNGTYRHFSETLATSQKNKEIDLANVEIPPPANANPFPKMGFSDVVE